MEPAPQVGSPAIRDARMPPTYTMMTPQMEALVVRAGSRFALVTLSAMRAGQISDYYNQLGEGLGTIVPPQVLASSHKPLSIAMEEIEIGKIEAVAPPVHVELGVDTSAGVRRAKRELWKVRAAPKPRAPKRQT